MPYPRLSLLSHSFIISLSLLLAPSSIAAPVADTIKSRIFPFVEIAQNSSDTEADKLFEAGEQLFEQNTPASFQAALKKFEQALPLYQASGNITQQAHTVAWIAYIYDQLGENQQALSYYNQALPLFRQINNQERQATALLNIGGVYSDLGDKQTALNYYNQALPLYRQAEDKEGEATTLNNMAVVYSDLGDKQQALNYYNQALPLYRQAEDKEGEAVALSNIAVVYADLGDQQQALKYYNQALPLYQQVGDKKEAAVTLNNIGKIYSDLGDKQTALSYYNQALPLYQQAGNQGGEVVALNNIGRVYSDLGDNQQALNYYNQALLVIRQLGDKGQEANTLNNIGLVHSDLGEKQLALDYYNQALPLTREAGDKRREAVTLSNIGRIYSDLGDKQTALNYYNQALPLSRQVGDKGGEANTLDNLGFLYSQLGEGQTALDYHNQALPLYRQVGDKWGEATTLSNMGRVYSQLGDKQTALNYYNQALTLSRQVGDKGGEANTLNSMGLLYSDLGDQQTALNYYNQALPLYQQVQYKWGEAAALNNIGGIYSNQGDKQTALNYYNQVLPLLRQLGDKAGEAYVLNNIGQVYDYLGDNQQALNYYNQVLPLLREVGDKTAEATVLRNLALLQRNLQQLDAAIANIEAAITIVENQRTKIVSEQLRQSYFAQNLVYYEIYIDLLMQLHQQQPDRGYDAKALNASERARARTLLELLAEANADIRTGVDPQLREQESNLQQQLNSIAQNQIDLLSREHTPAQAAALQQDLDNLLRQLDEIQAEIRRRSPGYAALTQPQPLTVAEIQQQVLDADTLLLQYALGENRSYLWVVSQTGVTSYQLPPKGEIEAAAKNFRDAITSPSLRIRPKKAVEEAAALSELILAPAAAQLGEKRLVIVSDGSLYYIPFAALALPGTNDEPLLVKHEIVNLPSASSLAILRQQVNQRPPAPKKAAILADPVFGVSDSRVSGKPRTGNDNLVSQMVIDSARDVGISGELAPLPNTRQEAAAILNLVPDAQEFAAFDFAANRQTATSSQMADYQIVHFATHGFFNSENPQLSGLVMSLVDEKGQPVDGFLRLHDIFNLSLNAELVVLSACQTGLGENVRGEGITGLTRGFMYAGAERLVTSLWSVDDEGTAALMTGFYEKMLSQGMTPAQALRSAQLEMWQSQEWKLPYFWAAFTLQGEWR